LAASTNSVTTPTAWATRSADTASAAWNSSWYAGDGWNSIGSDSA
jgi:hypothetical protein